MSSQKTVKEAVAVFHEIEMLHDAADELMINGFDRSDLSIIAGRKAVEMKLGHMYDRVKDAEDDPCIETQAYIGTDSIIEAKAFATGGLFYIGALIGIGTMVSSGATFGDAMLAASVLGGCGALIGFLIGLFLDQRRMNYLEEQMRKGGALLWVHTKDKEHEQRAMDILNRCAAQDVHVHKLPNVEYRGTIRSYLEWWGGEPKPKHKPASIIQS